MRPWMIAALLGAIFGMMSRRWLAVDVGRGKTYDGHGSVVYVVIGLGNRIYHNSSPVPTLSEKESSDAEGA